MKSLFMSGIVVLSLSMDASANLPTADWSQVQTTAPVSSVQALPDELKSKTDLPLLSRVYIDLGIHGPIGHHGSFDLYFGSPHRYYHRSHYRRYWGPPGHYKHHRYHRYHRPYRHHYWHPRYKNHRYWNKHYKRHHDRPLHRGNHRLHDNRHRW